MRCRHHLVHWSRIFPVGPDYIIHVKYPGDAQDRVIMSDLRAMRRKIGRASEDDGEANLFAVCDGALVCICA